MFSGPSAFEQRHVGKDLEEQHDIVENSEKTSMESEEHLLPKGARVLSRPYNGLKYSTHVAGAITFLIVYSIIIFMAGIAVGKAQHHGNWGSFETGFVEEGVVTPPHIFELVQTTFTGGVNFLDDEEVLGPSFYVGEPSPEIDEAWNAIIGGESHYFSISETEARQLWPADWEKYRDRIRGGWTGTLDLFHCLHCLNQLRKALGRDYYPEEQYRGMVHQLHCIDHLRQVIMCQGTSVISPSEWHDKHGQYINPKQLHTCRNFENLHEFSKARYNGSIAIPRAPRVPLSYDSNALPSA